MPTYIYVCRACGKSFELFQAMSDRPARKCVHCGRLRAERQIGPGAGVIFHGSGFYETDYRSASYQAAAKKDREAATAKSPAPAAGDTKASGDGKAAAPAPVAKEKKGAKSAGRRKRAAGD
jgi:putative FmdB family regulatory protein